jgi:hypothetical protein
VRTRPLVVFSHGMGQDSAGILALLTDPARPEFRERYVGKDGSLLVIHCDTMDEHRETVEYRAWTRDYCAQRGIEYLELHPSDGFHAGAWTGGLIGQYRANNTIGSVGFPSTCSDQLKIQPQWKAINARLARELGVDPARKGGLYAHEKQFGRVRCIIGFAAGEERRIQTSAQIELIPKKTRQPWYSRCVEPVYPLIDLGLDRGAVQSYLRERGLPVPRPSNCRRCFWKSAQELIHLERTDPAALEEWLELEANKLAAWADRTAKSGARNSGVKGSQTLRAFLDDARAKYGHLTTEQLHEYVMSHGHCVASKY